MVEQRNKELRKTCLVGCFIFAFLTWFNLLLFVAPIINGEWRWWKSVFGFLTLSFYAITEGLYQDYRVYGLRDKYNDRDQTV